MNTEYILELNKFLESFILESRNEQFEKVLNERTNYFTVVLEDIYQPHNASAVLRTCDCFGIQNVHIIENKNHFEISRDIVLGSAQWLNINKYSKSENNTPHCLFRLKEKGYRIVATTPHLNDQLISEFDVTKGKAAFVFGTELKGISDSVKNIADEFVKIPMYGFTESFNISVSAALVLHSITERLRKTIIDYNLTTDERACVKLKWLRNTIKKVELLEEKFNELK